MRKSMRWGGSVRWDCRIAIRGLAERFRKQAVKLRLDESKPSLWRQEERRREPVPLFTNADIASSIWRKCGIDIQRCVVRLYNCNAARDGEEGVDKHSNRSKPPRHTLQRLDPCAKLLSHCDQRDGSCDAKQRIDRKKKSFFLVGLRKVDAAPE